VESPNSNDALNQDNPSPQVRSPFSDSKASIGVPRAAFSTRGLIWGAVITLAVVIIAGIAIFSMGLFFNPLRTLREFPAQEYYDNHATLQGTRYRSNLTITGQIGWKNDLGRLVNCTSGDGKSPLVVLIPAKFDSIPMEAGEHFQAELLVAEGGLIKVNFLRPK